MNTIKEFQGEYRWLSNFAPVEIELDGIIYPTVEQAYMSAKSDNPEWKWFCKTAKTPGEVKKASRNVQLIHDWEDIKVSVMKYCLIQKYNTEPYKTRLRNTTDSYIQEGNFWHDTFWGVDLRTGKGKNILGKLIMEIRGTL